MTMTPIDPPGPCAYAEVIDVVLSAEPAIVAIEYLPNGGGGAWDVVYADGRFSYRYRDSTRSGTTFHIRPPGDYWPCPFRLHYEPLWPGTLWDVLYEIDLRTLPTQTLRPTIQYMMYENVTIDGKPWFIHYASGLTALVTGTGLQMSAEGGVSSGNGYAGLFVGLKLYEFSGWDAAKATAVQVRFAGPHFAGDIGAFHYSGGDGWGYGPGNNALVARWGSNRINTWVNAGSLTVNVSAESRAGTGGATGPADAAETLASFVLGAVAMPFEAPPSYGVRTNRRWVYGLLRRNLTGVSAMPTIESMIPTGGGSLIDGVPNYPQYRMGAFLGSFPGTQTRVSATLTHLRILQKAV